MNTTQNEGADPILERKRRRKEIMDDKRLNIWQKKFLLEELDEQESKPAPAPPKRDLPASGGTGPNTKPAPSATPKPSPSPTPSPTPTPTPAPTPAPGPAPQPSPTPPPKPAPARSPAPVHPSRPVEFDDTVTAPQESYDERMRKYAAERNGILNSGYIPQTEKGSILDSIDKKYGFTQGLYQKWRVVDDNRSKLKAKTDDVNRLRSGTNGLLRQRFDDEVVDDARQERERMLKQADDTVKGFGPTVAGLGGSIIDPTRVVDITLDGKPVGNARYVDGKATGNLGDVVKGLGGDVVWDRLKSAATIYDPDGNIVSYLSKGSNVVLEKDTKGNIINRYPLVDGEAQADIGEYADKFAVPFSYYHDKNGVYRAYAQPEMRGAPITVVRKEDQVYIDAYVDFSVANPQKNDPNALQDYEKKIQSAYDSIMETWDTKAAYNLDPLGNEAVTLNTTLHANNPYGQQYGGGIPEGHEAVRINLDENAFLKNVFGASSHVFTVDPKDPYAYDDYLVSGLASGALQSITIPNNRDLSYNLYDALTSQQYEKLLYNWKIENPGQMWLYNPEDAAHEFGHLLGLGDAYGAFYRGGKEADKKFKMTNDYGEEATFTVPKNSGGTVDDEDIMRGGIKGPKRVSDSNVALLANYVWRSGNPYYYNK